MCIFVHIVKHHETTRLRTKEIDLENTILKTNRWKLQLESGIQLIIDLCDAKRGCHGKCEIGSMYLDKYP